MSLITLEQFEEFAEAYPEMVQCYDFTHTYDAKDAVDDDVAWSFGCDIGWGN